MDCQDESFCYAWRKAGGTCWCKAESISIRTDDWPLPETPSTMGKGRWYGELLSKMPQGLKLSLSGGARAPGLAVKLDLSHLDHVLLECNIYKQIRENYIKPIISVLDERDWKGCLQFLLADGNKEIT